MGGLRPGVCSALVKWVPPDSGTAWAKPSDPLWLTVMASPGDEQTWQKLQVGQWVDATSSCDAARSSAAAAAVAPWPRQSACVVASTPSCPAPRAAASAGADLAANWAATATGAAAMPINITSPAQARKGARAIMTMISRVRMGGS